MAEDSPRLPALSPEHRKIAAGQFDRANQVVAAGDYDYGIRLLLSCCEIDPGNLIYRQALRRTQKLKFKNNLRGSRLAWLTTARTRSKVKRALAAKDFVTVLKLGEQVLTRNPWEVGTQMAMAEAADELGLLDLAIWSLEQARQKAPEDGTVNRALAHLYEKRGNFSQAIALWELVHKTDPDDSEAAGKAKELAARETIARGQYEASVSGASGRLSRTEEEKIETPRPGALGRKKHEPPPPAERSPVEPESDSSAAEKRAAREVASLKAKIDADPTNANAYLQLSALYRKNGQLDQARALLSKGLGPTGNSFELQTELADLEIEPFRQNLAITEQRLEENADEELRKIRVRLLKEINARELELYRLKTDRYPTEQTSRFELGVRLLRAGNIDEAIRELQAARSDPKLHWKCLLYLGHCFKSRNNWKLARRNFEESLQNIPQTEEAAKKELYFQLAQGCADAGDLEAAIEFATELANLDFAYRDIGNLLDEWQQQLEQDA
jgi:tetratricopeptide (TPR) repeat protein